MAMNLVIALPPELEGALNELARQTGVAPEALVIDALRDRLGSQARAIEPRDDWERLILQAGSNCGVSLPDEALSSEGLYE
jgi:predicted transcriptional regulator